MGTDSLGSLPGLGFVGLAKNRPFVHRSLPRVIRRYCGRASQVIVSADK